MLNRRAAKALTIGVDVSAEERVVLEGWL